MEIEIIRNRPAGARCNTLVENLMNAVAEIIDEFDGELTMKVSFVTDVQAPAVRVNGEVVGENLSMEEIVAKFSVEDFIEMLKSVE